MKASHAVHFMFLLCFLLIMCRIDQVYTCITHNNYLKTITLVSWVGIYRPSDLKPTKDSIIDIIKKVIYSAPVKVKKESYSTCCVGTLEHKE